MEPEDRLTKRHEVAVIVQEALKDAPFSLRDLAEQMGGSYGTLREWARGARNPGDDNVVRIAEALEARARQIQALADRMRAAAGGP